MTEVGRTHAPAGLDWVLLAYRIPRVPSTPRIAVWRAMKRLGVVQIVDGLVALPADARTQEQLEWVAVQVGEAGGVCSLWKAQLTSRAQERAMVERLAAARAVEYAAIAARASASAARPESERARLLASLRRELRAVTRRDFFPPAERAQAQRLVQALADGLGSSEAAAAVADAATGGAR